MDYFESEYFCTVGYWKAKWEARQYWYQKDAEFEERAKRKVNKMDCRKFGRPINFEANEKCKGFSKSCAGCPQPHE